MTLEEAHKCAELFKANRDRIDGILVSLPNFGEEKGIVNTLRFSGVEVPVLVHAFNDDIQSMGIKHRRDSFCGKMSVCNNLRQYGIPFTLTEKHTVDPDSESFRSDLRKFAGTCRVVKSLKNARLGSIGARPASFNTVRYSEKLLERSGISIETLDLSEVFGRAGKKKESDAAVKRKLEEIAAYVNTKGFPQDNLVRMATLGVVIEEWMTENELAGTAIQCWTSMEEYFGVVPCTIMSMLSSQLIPSACEVDITGLVSMYALQQASGKPSALLDWYSIAATCLKKCSRTSGWITTRFCRVPSARRGRWERFKDVSSRRHSRIAESRRMTSTGKSSLTSEKARLRKIPC
jgi:L-fucose isomerase-like protein